ncbi:MAG TPA: carboxypeptidase-like regulatory domain-containing protein [Longimicrobium sp.]|nr:carboxypeptidase-like regulatory domain-containing protein [Longimicrobium sp.]
MHVTKATMWMCLAALLAAAPAAGAQVVTGTVTGEGGAPLADISVLVARRDGTVVAATTADKSGRFSIDLPAAGSYRLLVMSDTLGHAEQRFRVAEDGTHITTVSLRRYPNLVREEPLSRRPVGPDGRPMARPTPGGTGGSGPAPLGKDN